MSEIDAGEHIEFSSCFDSARKGNVDAMCDLAGCYENGVGVDSDSHQALFWYKEAAAAGSVTAQLMLAHHYSIFDSTLVKAIKWARSAAEQGSPEGLRLAQILIEQIDDLEFAHREEIFESVRREAELGCSGAQTLLGERYEYEARVGNLTYDKAACWLDRAATQGSAEAYYVLYEIFFFHNIDSLHYAAKNPSEYILEQAICFLDKAVELGSTRAKVVAGKRILSWSDPKTYRPSCELIKEAARQGCVMGCDELVMYYRMGIGGVECDHVIAIALAFCSGDSELDVEARSGLGQDKNKIAEGLALAEKWQSDMNATLPI